MAMDFTEHKDPFQYIYIYNYFFFNLKKNSPWYWTSINKNKQGKTCRAFQKNGIIGLQGILIVKHPTNNGAKYALDNNMCALQLH